MNPLGAVTAINDIKNLKNRNNILRKKIKIIYSELKNYEDIDIPEIKNFDNLGGFHYGIPFFCNTEITLKGLRKNFKIIKYNWPNLDLNINFQDPDKFIELIYKKDFNLDSIFGKTNDIRDNLYFFDLNELMNLSMTKISKKIILSKNK